VDFYIATEMGKGKDFYVLNKTENPVVFFDVVYGKVDRDLEFEGFG
jgi:hypothetical protein